MVVMSFASPGPASVKSIRRRGALRHALALALAVLATLALPTAAAAHGPIDPAASVYLAHVTGVPAGVRAIAVDGDLRMWMAAAPGRTYVVLDYRGAPYLRFDPRGVQVNENSAMYYLNQVPPQTPPTQLGPSTAPDWVSVSSGHSYGWHDGRLHALASVALAPGQTDIGRWSIPIRVAGGLEAITGTLTYAPSPSIVWFWPIIVVLLCVLALRRLRRPELDERAARALGALALTGFTVAAVGEQLHGRPGVSLGQELLLVVLLALAGWGWLRLAQRRHGWFTFFVIAAAALWEGGSLILVLADGFTLLAVPPVVARLAVMASLAGGLGLLPLVFAMAERPRRARGGGRDGEPDADGADRLAIEAEEAWEASPGPA